MVGYLGQFILKPLLGVCFASLAVSYLHLPQAIGMTVTLKTRMVIIFDLFHLSETFENDENRLRVYNSFLNVLFIYALFM